MTTPTTSSPVTRSILSSDSAINLLPYGFQWSNPNITYSFVTPGVSYYATNYPDTTLWTNTAAFSLDQQNATSNALVAWSNVANLTFTNVSDNSSVVGDIRLGFSFSHSWGTSVGITYWPNGEPSGGDLWLDPSADDGINGYTFGTFVNSAFQNGSYAFYALLHCCLIVFKKEKTAYIQQVVALAA